MSPLEVKKVKKNNAVAAQATAIVLALVIFGVFIAFQGKNPLSVFGDLFLGSFGNAFSIQNAIERAIPLMLAALCTLIPAHLGMVVIGNEGALVMGGLGAVLSAQLFSFMPAFLGIPLVLLGGALVGGLWILLVGLGKEYRGVDPTISSLLLYYVGLGLFLFLVEGPLKDPLTLNKPSTYAIPEQFRIGDIPGTSVHWGIVVSLIAILGVFYLMYHSPWGFSARIAGGNPRAAKLVGLPGTSLVLAASAMGGAAAGLAGSLEIMAVHYAANASLAVGIGFSGILVAFASRQNPILVIPVSILLGGIQAAGGILQRRHGLSDATVDVFQGILFVMILSAEILPRWYQGWKKKKELAHE